jgi:HEAT repeat protein
MVEQTYNSNGNDGSVPKDQSITQHAERLTEAEDDTGFDATELQALLQDLYRQGTASTVRLGTLNPWDPWQDVSDLDDGVSKADQTATEPEPSEHSRFNRQGMRGPNSRPFKTTAVKSTAWQPFERSDAHEPTPPKARPRLSKRMTNEQVFAALAELLATGDEKIQAQVLDALKQVGKNAPPDLVKATCAMARHEEESIRRRAVLALGETKKTGLALPVLIEALSDSRYSVRRNAAVALGRLGDSRAVEALVSALQDPSQDVRRRAAEALGQLGDTKALDPLISALNDDDEFVRQATCGALGKLGGARAVGALAAATKDYYRNVRREAVTALGEAGGDRALVALITALKDRDKGVRRRAVEALDGMGDRRAVIPLITALSDSDVGVRKRVVDALGRMQDSRAIEPLLTALGDSDPYIRHKAAEAVEVLRGNRRVRPPAAGEIKATDATLESPAQMRATAASQPAGTTAQRREREPQAETPTPLQQSDASLRTKTSDAVNPSSDDGDGRPVLSDSPQSAVDDHQPSVATEDAGIGQPPDVTALVAALKDTDPQVRAKAAEILGQIGDPRAVKPLIRRFNDSELAVRQAAAKALDSLGEPAVKPLVATLAKGEGAIQRQAAHVLADRRDPRLVKPFIRALQNGDGIVQWEASRALRQIGTPEALAALKKHEELQEQQERSRRLYTRVVLAGFALVVVVIALAWAMRLSLG